MANPENEIPIPPLAGVTGPIMQPLKIIGSDKAMSQEDLEAMVAGKPTFDITITCEKCDKELASGQDRCPHCGESFKV